MFNISYEPRGCCTHHHRLSERLCAERNSGTSIESQNQWPSEEIKEEAYPADDDDSYNEVSTSYFHNKFGDIKRNNLLPNDADFD